MIDFVKKYIDNGFSCLPTKRDKTPLMSRSWNDPFSISDYDKAEGVGIICGTRSAGLECLDFDNHFGDAEKILSEYLSIPEVKSVFEKHKLPIETSQRGGFHLIFRCSKNDGNKKLAQRKNADGRPEAFIETRGEGGYFVAYPTKGYSVIKNDIFSVSTITEEERNILIANAISMNEYFPSVTKTEFESNDRPGDLYNQSIDSISEMKSILTASGWTNVEGYKWRRPGKSEGISATLGKVAPNILYVFTSNAYPFEPMKAYTPFQVLGLLKFNGDWKEAAKSIAPENTKRVTIAKQTFEKSDIEKLLLSTKIDITKHIDKPPTILSIKERDASQFVYKRVFTLGNFSCIIGKAKSKKTFFISIVTSVLLNNDSSTKFISDLPKHKSGILYFDTEQSEYDSYNVIKRIQQMAGTTQNLFAFNLRPFSPIERCEIVEYAFSIYGSKTGFCVIDGIADLSNAINDEDEATRVTTMLLRLSKVNNCHICTVLHQNKNDNFATGHLGSAIMKKAEIILSVTKSKDDKRSSEISNDMSRGVDFEPFLMTINGEGLPEISGDVVPKIITKVGFEKDDDEPTQSNPTTYFPF